MARHAKQRFLEENGRILPSAMARDVHLADPGENANEDRAESTTDSVEDVGVKSRHATRKSKLNESLSLDKMRKEKRDGRAKRGRGKQKTQALRDKAAKRAPGEHLTFAPDDAERARMIKILKRRPSNKERQALVKRLATEFIRIYKRKRKALEPDYGMMAKERQHGAEAAQLCIHRKVTPTQLIDYWIDHIGDFTGMKFPPLNFLAQISNVDRVAVEVMVTPGGRRKRRSKRSNDKEVHAYSGALDPRLRRGLIEAGLLETGELSDRFLMTIQTTAQALSQGRNLFVSAKLKPLVQWAVENLYEA